jgi:hypothetical protein
VRKTGTEETFTSLHLPKNWETFRPFLNFSAQASSATLIPPVNLLFQ